MRTKSRRCFCLAPHLLQNNVSRRILSFRRRSRSLSAARFRAGTSRVAHPCPLSSESRRVMSKRSCDLISSVACARPRSMLLSGRTNTIFWTRKNAPCVRSFFLLVSCQPTLTEGWSEEDLSTTEKRSAAKCRMTTRQATHKKTYQPSIASQPMATLLQAPQRRRRVRPANQ